MSELRVTPDPLLPFRWAGAADDLDPVHLDDDFARGVGLPGRVLHELWTVAQAARLASAGDPARLRALRLELVERGVPGEEVVVRAEPAGEGRLRLDVEQGGRPLARGGAETR